MKEELIEAYAIAHAEQFLTDAKGHLQKARNIAHTQDWQYIDQTINVCISHCEEMLASLEDGLISTEADNADSNLS